jgi:hypothetical protein
MMCNGKCTRHAISPSCPKHGGADKRPPLFGRPHRFGFGPRRPEAPDAAEHPPAPSS